MPKAEREATARRCIAEVRLAGFEHSYPHQLSGGMRQRVGLARALAVDAAILLMDEPFASVDEQTRRKFQEDLLALLEVEKKTVIFVTHSIEEAVYVSDQIVLLSDRPGRVSKIVRPELDRSGDFERIRREQAYLDCVEEIWTCSSAISRTEGERHDDRGSPGADDGLPARLVPGLGAGRPARPDPADPAVHRRRRRRRGHAADRQVPGRRRDHAPRLRGRHGVLAGGRHRDRRAHGPIRAVGDVLGMWVNIFESAPLTAIIPVLMAVLGFGHTTVIVTVFLFSVWVIALDTQVGVRQINPSLVEMARSFGAGRWQLYGKILVFAALPEILAGVRLGLIRGVKGVVIGQLLIAIIGVGELFELYSRNFLMEEFWALIILVFASPSRSPNWSGWSSAGSSTTPACADAPRPGYSAGTWRSRGVGPARRSPTGPAPRCR